MATAIEAGIGTLNYGRQAAKGTIGVAATTTVGYNRPKWRDGRFRPNKRAGQEEYVDGQRFASPTMFTDGVGGEAGTVIVQVQPENAGLFAAQILGVDTVTGSSDPWTHTITSAGTSGAWGTWWQKVGSAIGPQRELYWDSKIAHLVMQASVEQKVMHYDLSVMALVAGQIFDTDAAKTEDTSDPYLWTEVTGAFTFDGTIIAEITGEVVDVDTKMEPHYGDAISPALLVEGKGEISRTVSTVVTDVSLLKYRKAVWNATAPAAGTVPVKDIFYAAVSSVYTRSATRTLTWTTPKMAIKADELEVGAQPDGGTIPLEFTGPCLKSGATPALSVIALTGDSATYA